MSLKRRFEEPIEHDQKHGSLTDEHRDKRQRTRKKQTERCEKCGKALAFWQKNLCGDCKHKQHDDNKNGHAEEFETDFGDSIVSDIFNAQENIQSQVQC